MILGRSGETPVADGPTGGVTLDQILRRNARDNAERLALLDPPDRANWAEGLPRHLTWQALDQAVERLAACFQAIGLPTDAVVALQLPNISEMVIALLATQRAGLIGAPMPIYWRRSEAVTALGKIGARALITSCRAGGQDTALLAREIAAECFTIRFVAAFGTDVPDGVVPLDELLAGADGLPFTPVERTDPADHIALATFENDVKGPRAIARNHRQLLTAGLAMMLEAGLQPGATLLSAYAPSSLAGLTCGLLPWLLSGGTLMLHQAFDAERFMRQLAIQPTLVALPGPLVGADLAAALTADGTKLVAIWRAPERATRAERCALAGDRLLDLRAFGETGVIISRRSTDGRIAPIPLGAVHAPHGASGAPVVMETQRASTGTLELRGAMVQPAAFPPISSRAPAVDAPNRSGWIDTGYACRANLERGSLDLDAPPAGLVQVGGARLAQSALDDWARQAGESVEIAAFPDPLLGNRIVASAASRGPAVETLETAGAPALVTQALRGRRPSSRTQAA